MNGDHVAAFLKQEYKPFAQSIFAVPPPDKIKEALSRNLVVHRSRAAAVYRVTKSNSIQKDFTGREICILKGDLMVHDFAASNGKDGIAVLSKLKEEAASRGVGCWVEIFEEHTTSQKAVLEAGFIYATTKVSAFSDIRGIYGWWGPSRSRAIQSMPPPLEEVENLTLTQLQKNFVSPGGIQTIQKEIDAYLQGEKGWANHYSNYNVRNTWTAFSLRGFIAKDPEFIIKPSEMMRRWKEANSNLMAAEVGDTIAVKQFPFSMSVAEKVPGRKERVRFMRLDPKKGELSRHADISDKFAGVRDGLVSRFHIPIKSCADCRFKAWDARGNLIEMRLKVGDLYYLDQRKPHAVVNACETERIHFVFDVFMNPKARQILDEAIRN